MWDSSLQAETRSELIRFLHHVEDLPAHNVQLAHEGTALTDIVKEGVQLQHVLQLIPPV